MRKFLNLVLTFLVSGLWHGVHYLLWGLFNGIFVACGEKFKTRWKLLNQAVTFLLVSLLWAFFVWPDAWTSMQMIGSVFTTFNYGAVFSGIEELGLNLGEGLVLIAAVGVLWGRDLLQYRLAAAYKTYCPAARVAVICVLVLVVLVFGMYGIGFNAAEFIYSQF